MEIEGEEGKDSVVNSEDILLVEGEERKVNVVNSEDPLLEEGEEGKVSVVNCEDPLLKVVAGSDCISRSIQVPPEAVVTQENDQVDMDIEDQEMKVVVGCEGQENELQPSQSQHKKQKKSHIAQVEPQGVVAGTRSIQVATEADEVAMDIKEGEVKVGVGEVEEENELLKLLRK